MVERFCNCCGLIEFGVKRGSDECPRCGQEMRVAYDEDYEREEDTADDA